VYAVNPEPLFEVEPAQVQPPRYRPLMPPGRVRWSKLTGRTSGTPCDDCMQLHTERPDAPLARRARWRRVQGGADRLLCYPHAQNWRQADGQKPLPEEPRGNR
jgi:hypothetical protein